MRIYEKFKFSLNLNFITASLISRLNLKNGLPTVNSAMALFFMLF